MDEPALRCNQAITRRRVLIVDDNRDSARLMEVLLTIEGYEAWTTHDGPEAIEAAKARQPQVVLLDLGLPTMGGVEVAEALRCVPELSGCHIVAVSGYGGDSIPHPSPFDCHMIKPVDPKALIDLMAKLTGRAADANPTRTAPTPAMRFGGSSPEIRT